jgi:hypothetical protein
VGPNSVLVPTNQRAARMSPSSVVASENVIWGGFQNSRKASVCVNFTRSASGLRGHMPMNSCTSPLPSFMTSPG